MTKQLPAFPLRLDPDVRAKIQYIADDTFRTITGEITMLILKAIADYEREHGEIKITPEE